MSVSILFLSANPSDSVRLKTDEERRRVEDEIRKSPNRGKITIAFEPAVRPGQLIEALRRHRPDVVHFGGHGSELDEIVLESDDGTSKHVGLDILVELFRVQGAGVRVVVLNACYSKTQAEALTRHVDCAIGMSHAIPDATAIAFATAFYQGLAYGESVRTAFEASLLQVRLLGLPSRSGATHRDMVAVGGQAEPERPSLAACAELIERAGADASKIVLVSAAVPLPVPETASSPIPPVARAADALPRRRRAVPRPRRRVRLPFDRELGGPLGWALSLIGVLVLAGVVAGARGLLPVDVPRLPARAWPIGAGLVGLSAVLLGPWFYRRSILLWPEALRLRGDDPGHFRGRDVDVERLIDVCRDHPLTCLVGESGAGKSALVRLGLCRHWPEDDPMAPILIDQWGADWVEGPREALNEAFRRFTRFKGRFLLIFDQVDDYQIRHRGRFVEPGGIVWKEAAAVVAENPFWADLRDLIAERRVHALLVTRSDASIGLDSLRIAAPSRNFELGRLSSELVIPLLDELTEPDEDGLVVQDPAYGWERLKARLARDLAVDGLVLPIQMKLALQALRYLDALTVEAYQAAGGLRGLEALAVDRQAVEVATALRVEKRRVIALLAALVDRTAQKTVPQTTADLTRAFAGDDPAVAPLATRALEMLRDREVVRPTVTAGAGDDTWALDHDYLWRGVIEAERRVNRWSALLAERHRAFREAGQSLRGRWESLLSPVQQAGLAYQGARGRVSYAGHRRFAALSLLRFAPFLLAVAVGLVAWGRFESWRLAERARRGAEELHSRIASANAAEALDALWDLATSNPASRRLFLDVALASPTRLRQLGDRVDLAVQAAVGLDPAARAHLAWVLARAARDDPHLPDLGRELAPLCASAITDADHSSTVTAGMLLLAAMSRAKDPEDLRALADAFEMVPTRDVGESPLPALLHVLELAGTADPDDLPRLAQTAGVLARQLPETDRPRAAERIAALAASQGAPSGIRFLARALREVQGDVDTPAARAVAARVVSLLERADGLDSLKALAEGMGALPDRFSPEQLRAALGRFDAALGEVGNVYDLLALASGLAELPGNVSPTAARVAVRAVDLVRSGSGILGTEEARATFGIAATRLDASGRQKARAALTDALAVTEDPGGLEWLASLLALVRDEADTGVTFSFLTGQVSPDRVLNAFETGMLARAITAAQATTRDEEAERLADRIVAAMERTDDHATLRFLLESLARFPEGLSRKLAPRALARLEAVIGETSDRYDLATLAHAARLLGGEAGSAASGRVTDQVIAAMEATDNPASLRELAECLSFLPHARPDGAADRAVARLGEVAGQTIDDVGLDALATGLALIVDRADPRLLVSLLKPPTCAGPYRAALLAGLARAAGRPFEHDRWAAAAWAERQGWDVRSPPARPGPRVQP